jgi:hypothetical protein
MNHSDNLDALAAALNAAQAEFSAVPKDSLNPFFKSNYAALPEVVKTAGPVLAKHGLSVSQFIGFEDGHDLLTTYLLHKSGQWIAESARLHLVKDDPQAQGSAVTYVRRYSYMAVLGLVADNDDDGNAASPRPQQANAPVRQAPPNNTNTPPVQSGSATPAGDKVKPSAQVLELWAAAIAKDGTNEFLNDIYAKGQTWALSATQIGGANKAAEQILGTKGADAVERRAAHRPQTSTPPAVDADDRPF